MNALRIAFDASQTGRRKAGCGFYAAALLEGLLAAQSGDEFTVLTSFGNFFHDPCQALAFPHLSKKINYGPRILRKSDATSFWENQNKGGNYLNQFNIVHANNFWCPPWKIKGILIYTLHDVSFLDHPEWTTEQNRAGCLEGVKRAAKYANKFVAISEATKQAFLKHFPDVNADKIHVIYPALRSSMRGSNRELKRPNSKFFASETKYFLSVGTIEPRKNQAFLIDIYEQYRDRGGDAIALVFAGKPGWLMNGFQERIAKSCWAKDIHILGYVSDAELGWLYKHCVLNLYPSLYEGFGLPILEGISFGACTLCSNSTSMPEVLGDSGILLSPMQPEGWVHAPERLTRDKNLLEQLQIAAVKRSRKFNWVKTTNQINKLCHHDEN